MHDFTELDRKIDINKPEKYHISIQLQPDGFSFCILETYLKRYIGTQHYLIKEQIHFEDYLTNIDKILNTDPLLQPRYNSVSLMHTSKKAILVPDVLFNKEEVRIFFDINEQRDELEEIHYNHIPAFNTYNVFAVHHELLNLFRNKYKNTGIFHQWSSILSIKDLENTFPGSKAYIHFNKHYFDIVIVKDKRLLFCNSFDYKNENDFVFYVLNTFKKIKLELSDLEIIVIGDVYDKGKYFELLGKFVDSYEIGNVDEEFSYSPSLKNISKPNLYNLYNLYRCASLAENTEV